MKPGGYVSESSQVSFSVRKSVVTNSCPTSFVYYSFKLPLKSVLLIKQRKLKDQCHYQFTLNFPWWWNYILISSNSRSTLRYLVILSSTISLVLSFVGLLEGEKQTSNWRMRNHTETIVYPPGTVRWPTTSSCDLCLSAHHLHAQHHWEPDHYHPDPAGCPPPDPHVFLPQEFLYIRGVIHNCHYTKVPGHYHYRR